MQLPLSLITGMMPTAPAACSSAADSDHYQSSFEWGDKVALTLPQERLDPETWEIRKSRIQGNAASTLHVA